MTKQECLTKFQGTRRKETVVTAIWFICFFGILFCNLPLAKWMETHMNGTWIYTLYQAALLVFFFGNFIVIFWISKRLPHWRGIVCPLCSRPFGRRTVRGNGNCMHCGAYVFDEPLEKAPS
jgi:hypothetical protein